MVCVYIQMVHSSGRYCSWLEDFALRNLGSEVQCMNCILMRIRVDKDIVAQFCVTSWYDLKVEVVIDFSRPNFNPTCG